MTTTAEFVPMRGNTYLVRDQLRKLGARWDAENKRWLVPKDKLAQGQAIVDSHPRVVQIIARRSIETRVCWECGRSFTYSDCKRDGGDWSDSYCGC